MGKFDLLRRTKRLDADPVQQQLASAIIEAAEGTIDNAAVQTFVTSQSWDQFEAEHRIFHAVALVKELRPDLYARAKAIGQQETGSLAAFLLAVM